GISATSTSPSSCPTKSSGRSRRASRWPTCWTASPLTCVSTRPPSCSSTRAACPNAWRICSPSASATTPWPRITAASPRRAGRLDAVMPPHVPLDILAQQIVAECAAEKWREDNLLSLFRRAAPFVDLRREDFDGIVEMLGDGISTGRGKVGAYLHRDRVNGDVRGRRGARLAALTSGGAIPETGDYRVVA